MPTIPLTSACPSTLTIPSTSMIPSMSMIPSVSMVPSASMVPSVSTVPSASAILSASTISSASMVPSTSGVPSTSANAPFKSRTTTGANFITRFAQAALDQDVNWSQDVDSGLEFITPSDSEDSNNEHFDDVFGKEDENGNVRSAHTRTTGKQCQKPRTKSNHPHIPNIKAELANLQAQEGIRDDQLRDDNNSTADILPNVLTLKDGPLSLDQRKMFKPSRILAKAGHVASVPPSRTENLWNAFLSSEKDNWPTDEPLKAWNVQMKVKYATLFEGLNKNEAAAKKDSLLKGLQEKRGIRDFEQAEEGWWGAIMAQNANSIKKQACRPALHLDAFSNIAMITFLINRDFQDGYATAQNCTITRSPEITQALDPFKANILKTLHDAVRTTNTLKTTNSGEIEPEQLVEEKKHKALMNRDTAHAALSAFMKPILEPHGISILNSRDGTKWAFPMKQLGLKLCAKELTLVGWPDDLRVPTPNQSEYSKDKLVPFINNCAFSSTCHLHIRKWNSVAKDPDVLTNTHSSRTIKERLFCASAIFNHGSPRNLAHVNKTRRRKQSFILILTRIPLTVIHPQCCIRRGNSKHDDPGPTPVRTSRTILRPVGALVHTLTLTPALIPALIPALAPDIVLILNLLFNLSLNLKVIQGNSHDHDQEVPWWHTMSDL
ncbi:hypothetical protein BS47DRAFT_1400399 [Hydnum rufescens UP504]|uniref:Uncharacterized protein n=1 Tax=Hydnum rufescens UP504 TaxID=1448309 RepID=A0A9P6DKX8_9AGAM|nr:hypothetical protein BS47DRAFT_1400399 [Hydnum rufescens UP504]